MGQTYKHLSLLERETLTIMRFKGYSMSAIARKLGRHKATIAREVRRNSSAVYDCYLGHRAQGRMVMRRSAARQRPRLKDVRIRAYVFEKLKEHWSPEIIAGRLRIDQPGLTISPEAIYQFVYDPDNPQGVELIACLRRTHRRRRRKRVGRKERRTKIPNRIGLEQRPAVVATRTEFGHWEGDTLISRKSLATVQSLSERRSRLVLLTKLIRKSAAAMSKAVKERFQPLPPRARRSLTLDNGTENTRHEDITAALGTACYFCHPYAAWERGSNEQINGLVRWYLPKGTDLSMITDNELQWIEDRLNNRPRKCLGFRTPFEVASQELVALQG
jgi:IS30 family transposase